MNIFKRLSCILKLSDCDWDLVEIFPVDMAKKTTKRFFRCSKCKRVKYKLHVRE